MYHGRPNDNLDKAVKTAGYIVRASTLMCLIVIFFCLIFTNDADQSAVVAANDNLLPERLVPFDAWHAPDTSVIPSGKRGRMIKYGRELIMRTAVYFGPKGTIAHLSNGMNCQNCHINGGTRLYGNNFASFISTYPKISNRSGQLELPAERIAECFTRSLNGKSPDTASGEIQAMLYYMRWVGKDVKKNAKLFGEATEKLPYLNVAANAEKGRLVYRAKCQSCHGGNGQGLLAADKISYIYPPLWGPHSYSDGAGMYRLSNLAGFVKNNMPLGATYETPQLSDEEAWNVAAFINSQPRAHRDQHNDYINLSKKPVDAPFGPYIDTFSERQHKFGPFKPILVYQRTHTLKK
ncbi:c-type cytochrome [Mucilaginibacter sp. L3T2-6]|uniref:c-type cytochrome n=1 Tax=Mucilaginibacter sp. L3T2-6 TaxID=3062491 RepID=UPI0026753117|nr:c-type cytochrome [Mucilaginibacter sp. L3T2-6]MDO3643413.1 c-type cytochrome [Mucilaginibacter sp. L3T2-6]MDV6215654.1 c-type cytochrome [Mucilaginibacter sp. L3T2-6]